MDELYRFTNDYDTVVAKDLDDAKAISRELFGEMDTDQEEFRLIQDDAKFTIVVDESGKKETKTAAEWAKENGRGLLCSTEY